MNLPALSTPAAPGAFPVLDVESLLGHLPTEERARLAWAKPPIKAALGRLCEQPLTDILLRETSLEVIQPLQSVGAVFWGFVAANREEWRALLMEELGREQSRLGGFLEDAEARDTLEWVVAFLRSFFDFLVVFVQPEHLAQVRESSIAQVADEPEALAFVQGQVALMAAVEGAKCGTPVERVSDLLDRSFLEFVKARNGLRRHQVWITPFPHETVEERRQRLLSSVDTLRQSITVEDWQVFQDARLHDLR